MLPLYFGLSIIGGFQTPQPGASLHLEFSTFDKKVFDLSLEIGI